MLPEILDVIVFGVTSTLATTYTTCSRHIYFMIVSTFDSNNSCYFLVPSLRMFSLKNYSRTFKKFINKVEK